MALSTYSELAEGVARWAWRTGDTEFEAAVPEFIALTENVLNNGDTSQGLAPMRIREMEAEASIALTDGAGALPTGFLEARYLRMGADECELPGNAYEVVGDEIRVFEPTTYVGPIILGYYAAIPALTEAAPTNWLIEKDHRVYLYGSLIQAAAFSREEQRMGYWASLFISAVSGIAGSDVMARYSRSSSRPSGYKP